MQEYSREQIYEAMRRADAAGDADAVKALAEALKRGDSKEQIMAQAEKSGLQVNEADLDANIASRDADGPVNTVLPPQTTAGQVGERVQNVAAGMVEGATGLFDISLDVARGVQHGTNALLGFVGEKTLNALGLPGAAKWWSEGADFASETTANQPRLADQIQHLSPTPEGQDAERFAAQLLGGAVIPGGAVNRPGAVRAPKPQQATRAQEIAQAGKDAGVRVMTTDVKPPKGFVGKTVQAIGERIPFAGTGGARIKQNEERIEVARELAREFGVDGAQEFIDEVADDLAKTRGGKLTALKNRKDQVISAITAPFREAPKAVAAIDEQIAKLRGIDDVEYKPVIDRLIRFKEQLTSGKSLEQVEGQRRLLGELFKDQNLARIKGEGEKAIRAIYGPLRDDMGAFIRANGGDEAFNAWKSSNDELAAMAGDLQSTIFKNVLKNTETTPEAAARLLFSQKPSDVRRLFAGLSPKGKDKARAAVIHEAVMKAGGLEDISPQKFANALERFGRTTGVIFADDAPRVEGIVRLIQATQRASVAAASPPTGVQNTIPVLAAVLADWMGTAGGAITAAGVAGMAARLYESAPVRNLLVGLSKTKPGSKAEAAFHDRIAKALSTQADDVGQAANSNMATAAVAEQPKEQN